MKQFNIYIAGGMKNLSKDEYDNTIELRHDMRSKLKYDNMNIDVNVCLPSDYFNYQVINHASEKEVMRFELNKVRHSDLIIVDFCDPSSLGTMSEITVAYEHKIPILGLNLNNKNELHAWQIEMTDRLFTSVGELLGYIKFYYLT